MTADTTIDLNIANGNDNQSQRYSSNSSLGSNKSRFKYRGKMMAMRAMNQLPPVEENSKQLPPDGFRPLNKSRRAKWISITAIVTYLFIGTLTYALWIPNWNFADSIYFAMATFTTVGFGDIAPETDGQKAFTIFYIVGGTFLIGGIFYGYLFDHIFNSFEDISRDAKNVTSDYFMQRLDHGGAEAVFLDEEESFWTEFCRTFRKTIPLLVALIVPPLIMGYYEEWGVLDTFYFTVASSSTGRFFVSISLGYSFPAVSNIFCQI